uniref:F-box/kelch-repeat protein At3g23880-like n=1 Tax=Erigeron canadensis TaxID=72917 RepID=UPI001CB9AC77|nr:F-box/kelch-repeat protein At3g23880-like [Erigeron canadensis]
MAEAEAPELPPDILERILIDYDVKNLTRFKGVCKSWHSFISGSRFVNAHLLRSQNDDQNNNNFGHRKIVMSIYRYPDKFFNDNDHRKDFYRNDCPLIGSSNGLVCIYASWTRLYVANPLTKASVKLESPRRGDMTSLSYSVCWGFGYDQSINDYKVVFGFHKIGKYATFFQILSLKSNVWNYYGEVNYKFHTRSSILCNGALHWFMYDRNKKPVIVSFDLSKEEFNEVAQPEDPEYKYWPDNRLGIIKDCLCIFQSYKSRKWMMKSYNVKQSWELLSDSDKMQEDIAHHLRSLSVYNNRMAKSFVHNDIRSSRKLARITPIYDVISWPFLCIPNPNNSYTFMGRSF